MDAQTLDLMGKMLKKNPAERINAIEALNHSYFEGDHEDEEGDFVGSLSNSAYPSCESPLPTTSNPMRKELTKKDSCVDFKMGKENVFTGKV